MLHSNINMSNISQTSSASLKKKRDEVQMVPIRSELVKGMKYNGVHIVPSYIEFTEAIEGITYRQRVTIKNIGNNSTFIRIRQPSSIGFQVKALKSGVRLRPGLSVTTYVSYTFKRPCVLQAIIPIEIDEKTFDYHVICTIATEWIDIEPKTIDFGTIDIGYSSGIKIITIRNEGGKSTKFSVDIGKNDVNITVKPARGIVRPQKEMKLQVELIGMHEGTFYSEFWIKSVPNMRVPIKVNIIIPRLVVYHPNTAGNFTLIDFPPTVENTSKYNTFIVRNISSRVCNYVVLAELDNEVKPFRDIDCKRYPNYSTFDICPIEGRMDPFQGIIFEVGFSPTSKLLQKRQKHGQIKNSETGQNPNNRDFMAFIRIVRVHSTESEDVKIGCVADKITPQGIYLKESMTETSSVTTFDSPSTYSRFHDIVKFCLYGEMEMARLYFEPDILYFGDLIVNQISQRVIRLTNSSTVASMYLEFIRNAAARCYPAKMQLKPRASVEVVVKVLGKENIESVFKIFFDVMANSYVSSLTKRHIEKVKIGSYSVNCMVNIILKSKKGTLSRRSLTTKATNRDSDIIKRVLLGPKWKYKDYRGVIDQFSACVKRTVPEKLISTTKAAILIPLSPLQIHNVHIHPTMIAFGMVASKSLNYRPLVVENTNSIPVMVRLTSLSAKCICFPEGNLMILQPNSIMTKFIEYRADQIGKFNRYIGYTINDNHIFDLNVTADVVHKQLHLDKNEIEFGEEWSIQEAYRPMISIVQIMNKLGIGTSFRWEVPVGSGFHIEPISGSVRGNSSLYVYVYYMIDDVKTNYSQAIMKCEGTSSTPLHLSIPQFVPKVKFVRDSINLGEIPLNLPTKIIAILHNLEFNEVIYEVDNESLIHGCNVNPLRGKISPRGIAILEIHLTLDICCRFSTVITVLIHGAPRLEFRINGNVLFPRLKIVPQRIDMKRISADAFQIHRITATNIGTTILKLQFLLEEYPEFRISLSANKKDSNGTEDIIIAPGTSQNLYLHFQPIDVATYAFYLPMMLNELLGPVSILNPATTKPIEFLKTRQANYANLAGFNMTDIPDKLSTVSIDCTIAGRVVFFSKLLFRFNVITNELREELTIENRMTSKETVVSINIEEFSKIDCPFTIEWSSGEEVRRTSHWIECPLSPSSGVFFVLEFKPKKRGYFSIEAPIHVQGELDGNVFNKLHVDGEFPASSIYVEPSEIYFMPVPLGTVVEEKFQIQAKYFDDMALIQANFSTPLRCSGDYNNKLLSVDFLNGNMVPRHSYVELEAKVTFKSDKPVSFCLTIEFRDDHTLAECFLTVYAIADNNLLTTYMYLFNDSSVGIKHLRKYFSHTLTSSDSETTEIENDNGYKIVRKDRKISRFSVSLDEQTKSSLGGILASKLYVASNEEINENNVINNKHVITEQRMENIRKQISTPKRASEFLMDFTEEDYEHPENEYEKYLQRIITSVEEWLYSGPLKFQFYPNIPHGITVFFSNSSILKLGIIKGKSKTTLLFIDILEELAGPKIRNYLEEILKQPLPEDNVERIDYFLQLYDKILDFLVSQGAHLPHVSGQFLLNYDDYIVNIGIIHIFSECQTSIFFIKNLSLKFTRKKKSCDTRRTQCERMSQQLFESCSRQCWLDVILQTYKCFVLSGLHEYKFRSEEKLYSFIARTSRKSTIYRDSIISSTSSFPRQYGLHEKAIQNIAHLYDKSISAYRCTEETFLLAWLQYHYDQQCTQEWMTDRHIILNPQEKRDVIEHRVIKNFHSNLSDCLALIAVTKAYCPFLVDEYFNNIYICPRNNEEMLHNAICLVTAWGKIRLGFIITPIQLIHPNCVQMLILVVHLFQMLPTYIPLTKIKFSCPLSQTTMKQISILNPTDNSINYIITLVNNTNNFFTILKPVSILHLNARDSSQVQVQFHAKKIQKIRAYLLFCGCAIGPYFGRNQILVLEGHVDGIGISHEYNICSKLYEVVDSTLKINVPYSDATEYEIWMTEERPNQPSTLKMTRWCDLCTRKIPRRLFLNQKSIVVAEDTSEAYLSISVACIAPKKRTFWLIFQANTGDFIIQINSTWEGSLNDRIVVEWTAQDECTCSNQRNGVKNNICSFNVIIPIPSRNAQLWKCIADMFQKTLDSKERLFWSKYLDTHIGLRLIQCLMGDTTDSAALEFIHIFDTEVTYKVAISDKSGSFIVPEYLTIPDVKRSDEKVPIISHIEPTATQLYETRMILTSLDHKEIRTYIVDCLRC